MIEELGFYCHYGAGDIFESREFVRTLMAKIPAKKYVYYNGKSPRLLMDIPNLEVDNKVPEFMNPMSSVIQAFIGKLYINTWIGRDGRYVLPGSGCTVEKLFQMYNDILYELNISPLGGIPTDYLTSFDYSMYGVEKIDKFMAKFSGRKKVYISNGNVQSNQAKNFDMDVMISSLALTFPDILFFVSQALLIDTSLVPNVVNMNQFTPEYPSKLATNLVELSYLSTFCDLLIGRNSGPQVFAWTKDNCFSDKANITFTYNHGCHHFVHSSPIKMKKYWADFMTTEETFLVTKKVIEELLV